MRTAFASPPWLVLLAALLPLGCPVDEAPSDDEAGTSLLSGDLVITEFMASPDGSEEWFEIYNATGQPIDLEGLVLAYEDKSHVVARSVVVEPGDYVVVANVLDEIALATEADHVDYGYANELGDMVGTHGRLALVFEDSLIDEVYYGDPVMGPAATKGVSRSFDGAFSPDASVNDPFARWCDSRTAFEGPPAFLGTPGAPNDLCSQGDNCVEDGVERPVVYAAPGDFVITEIHANPDVVDDALGEWFEIHALADFDLNGLSIGLALDMPAEQQLLDPECMPVQNGDYVVFARELDTTINGGLPADALLVPTNLSLKNSDGSLWLDAAGIDGAPGERIDAVTWTSVGTGATTQLDPDYEDPLANDTLANWCDATLPYGLGDRGSPGAANEECAIVPPEGQCVDPDTRELRDIAPLASGELVITEIFANPVGDDGPAEWFELAALGVGDLNGLNIGKAGAWADLVEAELCLEVVAGDYLVFAHESDPALNGGLPQVDALFDMALNNSSSDLIIGYAADPAAFDDQATWTTSSEGLSQSYGGALDVIANDDLMAWCEGNPSSPGEANPSCGGGMAGMCLDLDTNEMRASVAPQPGDLQLSEVMPNPAAATDAVGEWFEFHTTSAFDLNGLELGKGGSIAYTVEAAECIEIAADSWIALALEGDPLVNGGVDPVTWVYDAPSLTNAPGDLFIGHGGVLLDEYAWANSGAGVAWSRDLDADTWCAAVDPFGLGDLGTPALANPACGGGMMGDQCLDNGVARAIVPPQLGQLVITELMANPNAVADATGEWFELRALANVDLNGLELGNAQYMMGLAPDLTLGSNDCLAVTSGETILFARSTDPAANGDLPTPDFTFSFGLTNSNAFLYVGHAGALLDQVQWTASGTGASTSLDPDSYDPALNDTANNAAPWCYQTQVYGAGDKGTPDADNLQCP